MKCVQIVVEGFINVLPSRGEVQTPLDGFNNLFMLELQATFYYVILQAIVRGCLVGAPRCSFYKRKSQSLPAEGRIRAVS